MQQLDNESEKKYLTKRELEILYEHWKRDFLSYENDEFIEVWNKIQHIVNSDALDKQSC